MIDFILDKLAYYWQLAVNIIVSLINETKHMMPEIAGAIGGLLIVGFIVVLLTDDTFM